MKKENKILFGIFALASLILLVLVLNSNQIQAQDEQMPDILGINPENLEKIPQSEEELKELGKSYIKREWGVLLRNENTTLGKFTAPVLNGYDKIAPYTNPIFRYTLGIEPGLNWLFILTFIIWINLVTNLYTALSIFSTFSKTVSFIISLAIIVIISNLMIPKWIAQKIINMISVLTSWWMQLIAALIIFVILILISIYQKEFEVLIKKWKEERRKRKIEQEIEKLKIQGKSQAEIQRITTDMFGEIGKEFEG